MKKEIEVDTKLFPKKPLSSKYTKMTENNIVPLLKFNPCGWKRKKNTCHMLGLKKQEFAGAIAKKQKERSGVRGVTAFPK